MLRRRDYVIIASSFFYTCLSFSVGFKAFLYETNLVGVAVPRLRRQPLALPPPFFLLRRIVFI